MLELVKAFVSKKLGVPIYQIHEETTIESDLRIIGLDTISFFEEFFNEFKIENPEDFKTDLYVTPEVFDPIGAVRSLISKEYRDKHKIKEVSISHLVMVAELRRWTDIK